MTQYASQIYTINAPQAHAYERMADLRHFERLKAALADPQALAALAERLPADQVSPEKLRQAAEQIKKMEFTADTLSADSPVGHITLAIVEREPHKLVKLATQGAPLTATLWVQVLPKGDHQAALKVTLGAELNFFIRKMVEKHLRQAPDGIAAFLANLLAV